MNQFNNYENLYFNYEINTINTDFFPSSFSLHWHKYTEIIALPNGAKIEHPPKITIHGTNYSLFPGDFLFIWPGELHEIVENREHQLIGIQFPAALIHDVPDFIPYQNYFRALHHISHESNPELAQNLISTVEHMIQADKKNTPFHGVEILIHLYELFMELGHFINQEIMPKTISSISGTNTITIQKINMVSHYITDNCKKQLTLSDAATYCGFSPTYFSRIFKQISGYSFIEYLSMQRVKRAQSLLADTSLSITEIAYNSGFHSISTFNRVFHQNKGCSPSEYRTFFYSDTD